MKRFLLLLLCLGLAGCATKKMDVGFSSLAAESFPAKSDDAEIILTMDEELERPYKEIGIITAVANWENATYEELNEKIGRKAREVGADAVIKLEYSLDRAIVLVGVEDVLKDPVDYSSGQGVAVVFIDLQN